MKIKPKRIIFILSFGLILIGVVAAFLYFHFARPIGTGPAGPTVARESFSQPWSSRQVIFIGLGDSVTAGFGARKGYSYFDRLVKNPVDEYSELNGICLSAILPKLLATNLAVSGSTSTEVANRQLALFPTNDPSVQGIVVLTTGGNDIIHNYGRTPPREEAMYGATWEQARPWVENYGLRLEGTIAQIESRFPGGCEIFVANIFDPTDGVGDTEGASLPTWKDASRILDAYNLTIKDCAARHPEVHLIDLHAAFLGHGIHCTQFWREHFDQRDPHYWLYFNLEDPNERGYDAIRRLFLIEIANARSRLK